MTLAVDGRVLKAHKMVLSACSPYFQRMFEMTPDKHPVVFIDRVFYKDMKRLLEFMYQGEVSIDQSTLNRFLKVARSLKIRGLTDIEESTFHPSTNSTQNGISTLLSAAEESLRSRSSDFTGTTCRPEPQCRFSSYLSRRERSSSRISSAQSSPHRTGSEESGRRRARRRTHSRSNSQSPTPAVMQESDQVKQPDAASIDGVSEKKRRLEVPEDLRTESERDTANMPASPVAIKQEQDVFCQPDIWISEGIFVDGQQESVTASASCARPLTPGAPSVTLTTAPSTGTSQSGGRSTASPVSSAFDDALSSPDDGTPMLDYITHEDGSVTCKLCGEQVPSRNHWYRHKYRTHAWHTYKCEECGITYKSKRGFEAHLEAKHDRLPPSSSTAPTSSTPPVRISETARVEHADDVGRRRDWEGMARALEHSRKKREEELVSDIIKRVKRECAMEGEDYTRRGYVKHF